MNYSELQYRIRTASWESIVAHLTVCSDCFSPPLSSYVDIAAYGKKIANNAVTFECWFGSRLIGLVAAYFNDNHTKTGFITDVSVIAEYQGHGIASDLLGRAIEFGRRCGFTTLVLELNPNNIKALTLYEKHNFVVAAKNGDRIVMSRNTPIPVLNHFHTNRPEPLVSVCCVTYNHESFIKDAIEGFLMQETSFPYEIIIHDDCSTDSTGQIVREYQQRHPDLIITILQTENQHSKGRKIFPITFERARGKYIALCEGDDYWADPHKLRKQVEFLETHPECAICFHGATVIYEDGRESHPYCVCDHKEISTLEDILIANFIPTCSVMFRNGLVHEFPTWYYQLPMGDWPLYVLLAQYGKIGYLDQVMTVYRVHQSGAWNSASNSRRLRVTLEMYGQFNQHFLTYQQPIMTAVSRCLDDWAEVCAKRMRTEAVEQGGRSVSEIFGYAPKGLHIAHLKSRTLGRFSAVTAMLSYQAGDLSKVRQSLFRALWYDPSWLRNRGVWSIGIEVFLGRPRANWLKHGLNILRRRSDSPLMIARKVSK